jgi:hypothetical protein
MILDRTAPLMGYSLSWLGVKNVSPGIVRKALRLKDTGQRAELPESPFNGLQLPNGWYFVIADHQSPEFFPESVLAQLSTHGELVICFVEEHVMYSSATGWKDGRQVWSIYHDSQRDIEDLEATGDLPPSFGPIRDKLRAAQEAAGGRSARVDFTFDVPVELAQELTGYRHDANIPELAAKPFEILARSKWPWFKAR